MNEVAGNYIVPEIDPRFNPLATLDPDSQANLYAGDNKLAVTFHTKAVLHPIKSTEAGRPVYDEVDYIRIQIPGISMTYVDAPVDEYNYMQRFGDRYRKWKESNKQEVLGTPISSWPFTMTKISLVAELSGMGINSVEQLANLHDGAIQGIMGGQELRKRAQEWLDTTTGTDAVIAKLSSEKDQLKSQMEVLQKQMGELLATQNKPAPLSANRPFIKDK